MSDTKLPEAMVEAACRALSRDSDDRWPLYRATADHVLTAANVPAMLACVECLRAICSATMESGGDVNAALAKFGQTPRQVIRAFDKSFPQRPVQGATDTVKSSD
jgi:hypothetical protein